MSGGLSTGQYLPAQRVTAELSAEHLVKPPTIEKTANPAPVPIIQFKVQDLNKPEILLSSEGYYPQNMNRFLEMSDRRNSNNKPNTVQK